MRTTGSSARLLLGIGLAALASACGGGGGGNGGVIPGGPQTASFAAADATPPDGSVSLQQGSRAGVLVNVLVQATGVDDFFGAGFRLNYDPAVARFESASDAGSFLRDPPFDGAGAPLEFQVDSSTPGSLFVGATRLQNGTSTATGVDVGASRTLISLQFRLLAVTAGSPVVLPGSQREARDSQDAALPLTWHAGSLVAN
jgi:hypothetical protein